MAGYLGFNFIDDDILIMQENGRNASLHNHIERTTSRKRKKIQNDNICSMQLERYEVFKAQDHEKGHFDCALEIDGKKLYVHKYFLATASQTFNAMISDRWNKNNDNLVKIEHPDYSFDDIYQLMCFIYSCKCEITKANVVILTDMAEFYGIDKLKENCIQFLLKMDIIIDDIEKMVEVAQQYSVDEFVTVLKASAKSYMGALIDSEHFVNYKKPFIEFLSTLVRDSKLDEPFFDAVYKWAHQQALKEASETTEENFNFEAYVKNELKAILPKIKFSGVSFKFVKESIVGKRFLFTTQHFYCIVAYSERNDCEEEELFEILYESAKDIVKGKYLDAEDDFKVINAVKQELSGVLSVIRFHRMNVKFLMDFVVDRCINFSLTKLHWYLLKNKKYTKEEAFKTIYLLAEKRALKKQQLLPVPNFQTLDAVKNQLTGVLSSVNFYEMNVEFWMNLAILKTRDDKRNLLRHFAEVYMMPWEFWVNLFCNHGQFSASQKKYMLLSFSPYCYEYKPPYFAKENIEKVYPKLRHILIHISYTFSNFKNMNKNAIMVQNYDVLIENLRFPHCHLDKIWKVYEKNICLPPSKIMIETYQKMKDLHEKLELLKGKDDELWFSTLLEVENYDAEFVEQMTEYQIGRDLSNQKLWKMYIIFLKRRKNEEKLRRTYSKYCRFYLDDNEMKEEYRIAVEKRGSPFEVPWKNPFDFETYNENAKEQRRQPPKPPLTTEQKKIDKCAVLFSPEGISHQNFPFRDSFIHYIISTSSAFIKQKIYKSCKYFYTKYPAAIIYKFIADENSLAEEIFQDSIQVSDLYKLNKHDIHISTVFTFNVKSSSNYLSSFIRNVCKCEARYIEIFNQNFTFTELKHLIGHGNVAELTLEKCVITYDDDQRVPLENILEITPKLEHVKIRYPKITPETAKNLLNLQFQSKFSYIMLDNLTTDLEPYTFVEFLNKNCLHDCEINLFDKESLRAGDLFKVVRKELGKKWGNGGPRFGCNTLSDDFDTLH